MRNPKQARGIQIEGQDIGFVQSVDLVMNVKDIVDEEYVMIVYRNK